MLQRYHLLSASEDLFIGIIGGDDALRKSIEGAEDSKEKAINDLNSYEINSSDTLIGISCRSSGLCNLST